jgi:hypothetical protein
MSRCYHGIEAFEMIRCYHGTSTWTLRRAQQDGVVAFAKDAGDGKVALAYVSDDGVDAATRVRLYPDCPTCKAEHEYEEAHRLLQGGKT